MRPRGQAGRHASKAQAIGLSLTSRVEPGRGRHTLIDVRWSQRQYTFGAAMQNACDAVDPPFCPLAGYPRKSLTSGERFATAASTMKNWLG